MRTYFIESDYAEKQCVIYKGQLIVVSLSYQPEIIFDDTDLEIIEDGGIIGYDFVVENKDHKASYLDLSIYDQSTGKEYYFGQVERSDESSKELVTRLITSKTWQSCSDIRTCCKVDDAWKF